jgi:hypothetical protein
MIYADPSFLFSLYAWDNNTALASDVYSKDARRPLLFTPWQRFELRNAFRLAAHRLRRAGAPVPFQIGNVLKRIEEDASAGRLRHVETDWRETLRLAEDLSAEHTEAAGPASVDVWHVACAILLRAEVFWTLDAEQFALAHRSKQIRHVPQLISGKAASR